MEDERKGRRGQDRSKSKREEVKEDLNTAKRLKVMQLFGIGIGPCVNTMVPY